MINPQLSICIPTYGRSDCLQKLLNNMLYEIECSNLWHDIEVCISDNCSTDDTKQIIANVIAKYPQLHLNYHCNESNLGYDCNLLQAVKLASGGYCWLFGDDDKFEDGALFALLSFLQTERNLSGITVNVQSYAANLLNKIPNANFRPSESFKACTVEEIYAKLTPCLGFISSQIIKRELWNDVVNKFDLTPYYTGYIHLFIMGQIIKSSPNWMFLHQRLVGWRSDNDSALSNKGIDGVVKRMRLDYEYLRIAADIFGAKSKIYSLQANQICGVYVFGYLQYIKFNFGLPLRRLFGEITQRFYFCPNYYLKILPIFLLPRPLVTMLKVVKKCFQIDHI